MYHKQPIIKVKKSENDGFTVIAITGPGAEEIAEKVRGIFEVKDDINQESTNKKEFGCWLDIDTRVNHKDFYKICRLDIDLPCKESFAKEYCFHWRPINQESKEV